MICFKSYKLRKSDDTTVHTSSRSKNTKYANCIKKEKEKKRVNVLEWQFDMWGLELV